MTSLPALPPDSSSSSPSLPFRPFSRLPTELVRHIIESTVPLSFHSKTYHDRQTTLRSLCLTSRLFRQIAQPLLLSVAHFKGQDFSSTSWRSTDSLTRRETIRSLISLSLDASRFDIHDDVFASLRLFVIQSAYDALDMAKIAGLVNLTTLRLSDVDIVASTNFKMANLTELQFVDVGAEPSVDQVVSRARFPSLRIFTLYDHRFSRSELTTILSDLEPQLECLFLDHRILNHVSIDLVLQINPKTLFDDTATAYIITNAQYVRIIKNGPPPCALTVEDITKLEELLRITTVPGPELIYLPSVPSLGHDESYELLLKSKQLEQTANLRKIGIIHEEQPYDWALDSGISMDFWRRMKELKAKGGKE